MSIQAIGLFGNPAKDGLTAAVAVIERSCRAAGVAVLIPAELAATLGRAEPGLDDAALVARADLIIALGGDGTMLQAARAIGTTGVPLLGINLGSLGYLTDVPVDELETALGKALAGEYSLEPRARVYGQAWRDGRQIVAESALNDFAVNMGALPRALDLELRISDQSLGKFLGDGMIFSTPTGSTAYSLSAGGPICHAAVAGLLLTPICPHSLGMRPLIVSQDTKVELLLHDAGAGATLSADGRRASDLQTGDRLSFRVSDPEVNLVKFPRSDFFRVLRHKLQFGAPQRHPRKGH
jgi:NAD+ kinase